MKSLKINLRVSIITLFVLAILLYAGICRLKIDTDITESLPHDDPIIADAMYLFKHHPIQDQIAIDIGLQQENPDLLIEISHEIEKKLSESGLFKKIGMKEFQTLIPELMFNIIDRLPYLYTYKELQEKVDPLITPAAIDSSIEAHFQKMLGMDGIGQLQLISKDPLGFKNIALEKLKSLAPAGHTKIYKEKLISADNRHLLLTAVPMGSGTDTKLARKLTALIHSIGEELNQKYTGSGNQITLTSVGAFRAALDNETTIRNDSNKALFFTIIGISILLLISFSRPLIGLLALIPALAGAITAFFVFSIFYDSISILVIGFGGTVISAAVDHGIAYLLFLDRPHQTSGKEASHEIWTIGIIATLTTVIAFLVLTFSGFPILLQLGQFSALGIFFSFLFVHMVFPKIILQVPPARKGKTILTRIVEKITLPERKGLWIAGTLAIIMMYHAKPVFNVELSRMNAVGNETLAAEKLILDVWGNLFEKVYLITEESSIEELQSTGDDISKKINKDIAEGKLSSAFVPSMIFPGTTQKTSNLRDWQQFWNNEKVLALQNNLFKAGMKHGFTTEAFSPFLTQLTHPTAAGESSLVPESFYELLGITQNLKQSYLSQLMTFSVGKNYDSQSFYNQYHSYGKIFDPNLFSSHFGQLLFSTFIKMVIIVGISVFIILFLFYLDIKLTLITLLPVFFSFICTLGTLNLIGHPLDIACVMLSIIIMGMGVDYSVFFVKSFQNYQNESHPSFLIVRTAVFLAATSTLIGFGVLCSADHLILRSVGLTGFFGIGYSLLGAFIIIPPLLRKRFLYNDIPCNSKDIAACVRQRYNRMDAYIRMFARYKMMFDPMFKQFPDVLANHDDVKTIVDIGTGYGVPACWCLEFFKQATVFGLEPGPDRVHIASLAVGNRGLIVNGKAPDVPKVSEPADLVLMLDMLHYLNDDDMTLTFKELRKIMADQGLLILRTAMPAKGQFSFLYWIEELKLKSKGMSTWYKSIDKIESTLIDSGFKIEKIEPSSQNGDLMWFIATIHQ